jgi:hypothetical protein
MHLILFSGKDLQVKWKSIRDAYIRSIKIQNKKFGDATAKTKKYVYAKQMEFLNKTLSHNRTEDSNANSANDSPLPDMAGPEGSQNIQDLNLATQQTPSTVYRRSRKI